MDSILRWPSRFFGQIYQQHGNLGVIIVGMIIVMAAVGIFIFLDRRK